MKNLILSALMCFVFTNISYASSDPIAAMKVISSAKVEVTLFDVSHMDVFEDAVYFPQSNILRFETKEQIRFIQVMDENDQLKLRVPVRSNVVKISKSIFEKGNYKLGFMIANEKEILYTNLTVN